MSLQRTFGAVSGLSDRSSKDRFIDPLALMTFDSYLDRETAAPPLDAPLVPNSNGC